MALLEEGVATPFGTGFVRISSNGNPPRVVRREIDPKTLELWQDTKPADAVVLIELTFDHGISPDDGVLISCGFPADGHYDGDEGVDAINYDLIEGSLSIATRNWPDLEKLGFVFKLNSDPVRLEDWPLAAPRDLRSRIIEAPPTASFPVAFAWVCRPGSSSETDYSAYSSAEEVIIMDRLNAPRSHR